MVEVFGIKNIVQKACAPVRKGDNSVLLVVRQIYDSQRFWNVLGVFLQNIQRRNKAGGILQKTYPETLAFFRTPVYPGIYHLSK